MIARATASRSIAPTATQTVPARRLGMCRATAWAGVRIHHTRALPRSRSVLASWTPSYTKPAPICVKKDEEKDEDGDLHA